jgi:YHS domain-containing protein
MKKLILSLAAVVSIWALILVACAGSPAPMNVDIDGIALKGYDPVAYFTAGKPVKGQKQYQFEWKNAKWYFSSSEHLELFAENPARYAPQYGGYCAYAVSRGTTADIDPESWAIVNGKLYLNLNKDVQNTWNKDRPGYIEKADKNWPKLLQR